MHPILNRLLTTLTVLLAASGGVLYAHQKIVDLKQQSQQVTQDTGVVLSFSSPTPTPSQSSISNQESIAAIQASPSQTPVPVNGSPLPKAGPASDLLVALFSLGGTSVLFWQRSQSQTKRRWSQLDVL